jgi:hypothetical protein
MADESELSTNMMCADAASWADVNRIKLQAGTWSFTDRPYLVEPMQARLRGAPNKRCIMKGTQAGFTEMQVVETLWGLIQGYYPRGALYLFPTMDEVREFSKARFSTLISSNPTSIGQYVQDTNTATLKKVGSALLYLRGANLTMQGSEVGDRESAKLRGIPVDKVIYDEYDLMDPDVRMMASQRMGDSEIKEEVYLSNPTTPDFGIATLWKESDQRYWFRRCECGEWTSAEWSFPECVKRGHDGKGYIACIKCGRKLDVRSPGEWVPMNRANSEKMWGYHWSQLTSRNNDPWDILDQYTSPPDGKLGPVVRFRLGRPYVQSEDRLRASAVLACCGNDPQMTGHPGPCAMGVDVRRHKNVVIGIRTGRDRYQILRVARLESWDDVLRIGQKFHVKSCVVDIRPYEDSAREFQKKAKWKTWLCEYLESTPVGTQYSEATGIVKVNRTEVMDATHRLVVSERQLEIPAVCPEVRQFALECSSVAKIEEVHRKTRQIIFRYHKLDTAPDDYRHALNYWYLAASNGKIPVVGDRMRARRPSHANNDYKRY